MTRSIRPALVPGLVVAVVGVVLVLVKCGGGSSPTEPSCLYVQGNWGGALTNSCGSGSGTVSVGIRQTGCSFTITGLVGSPVSGTMHGNVGTFTFNDSTSPCQASGSGSFTLDKNVIRGRADGTLTASGAGCCPVGPYSISFTLGSGDWGGSASR